MRENQLSNQRLSAADANAAAAVVVDDDVNVVGVEITRQLVK